MVASVCNQPGRTYFDSDMVCVTVSEHKLDIYNETILPVVPYHLDFGFIYLFIEIK